MSFTWLCFDMARMKVPRPYIFNLSDQFGVDFELRISRALQMSGLNSVSRVRTLPEPEIAAFCKTWLALKLLCFVE